jgi:hypothetical protein
MMTSAPLSSHFRPAPKGAVPRTVIALLITAAMLVVGVPAIARLFDSRSVGGNAALFGPAIGSIFVVLMINLVAFLAPGSMRYRVVGKSVYVATLLSRKRWDAEKMRARPYRPERWLRVAGTGMPGYLTGGFRLDGVTAWVAASQRDGVLMERADGKPVFVSPEDREGFLRALRHAGAEVTDSPPPL